jgi:hypothetical protein
MCRTAASARSHDGGGGDGAVKVVVIVLVLVVVLAAVAAGAALAGDDGSAAQPAGLVEALRGAAQRSADVDPADVGASCPDLAQRALVFTGTCNLTVAPADARLRTLRLHTEHPVTVAAAAPEGDVDDIEADVDAGKDITVAVGPAGAGGDSGRRTVGITCHRGLAPCTVRVLAGA